MSGKEWVVELEQGVWLAPVDGDPGRTLVLASATRFSTVYKANLALRKARNFRRFRDGKTVRVF